MITVLYTFLILGGLGLVLGIALAISSVVFYVKEDTRVEDVKNMLPNYNCGACGYAGCAGFSEAIIKGEVCDLERCKPGKAETNYKLIRDYLEKHPNEDGTIIKVTFKE